MEAIEILERHKELLTNILKWWEDAQFDTWGGDHNVYDEDPDFVVNAKALWVITFGDHNPHEWTWL